MPIKNLCLELKENLLAKVESINYKLKNFINSIIRVCSWIPIIWQDRDWDYIFLFIILNKKLSQMENFFHKSHIASDHEKIAREIGICVKITQKIIDDSYDKLSNMDIEEEKKILHNASKFKKYCKWEESMRKKDLKTLFDIMRENVRSWWD